LARTTGRADYDENGNDRYSFCEGSQKYKLHAPVGACGAVQKITAEEPKYSDTTWGVLESLAVRDDCIDLGTRRGRARVP